MGESSAMELLGDMWMYIPDWKGKNAMKANSLYFRVGILYLFGMLEAKERNCPCHLNFTLSQCESYFQQWRVSMIAKTQALVYWFCSCDFQDWEDSHGERSKKILQQVLLPHEIVANFIAIGEEHRMMGREVPFQNYCFVIATIGIFK